MPPTWEITQIAGYANYFATVAATKAAGWLFLFAAAVV